MEGEKKRPIDPIDEKAIQEHKDLAKWNFRVAKNHRKEISKHTKKMLKHLFFWTKKSVDVADRTLGAKIAPSSRSRLNFFKNNIIKILLTGGIIAWWGYLTKKGIDTYQDYKWEKQEKKEYMVNLEQKWFVSTGNTFNKWGKTYDEFTYIVTAEDIKNAEEKNRGLTLVISDKFDKVDIEHWDIYRNTGYNNIYDKNNIEWEELNQNLREWDKVFFKARKNKKENIKNSENMYRDSNPDYFNKSFQLQDEIIDWMHLRNDVWMSFYRVEKWDNLFSIRKKLFQIPKFSYLKEWEYWFVGASRNIKSFNIKSKDLKPWMWIPIPMENTRRQISLEKFKEYSRRALDEMKTDKTYGKAINNLIQTLGEDKIVDVMTAFARSETTEDWKEFLDNIWSVTYHRREDHLSAFSFSPYHILMEWNADGKTMGPWLKARKNLLLTEGQTYHPQNAGKLFLAYWMEKVWKDKIKDYIDLNNNNKSKIAKKYNWSSSYWKKLYENYKYVKNN